MTMPGGMAAKKGLTDSDSITRITVLAAAATANVTSTLAVIADRQGEGLPGEGPGPAGVAAAPW